MASAACNMALVQVLLPALLDPVSDRKSATMNTLDGSPAMISSSFFSIRLPTPTAITAALARRAGAPCRTSSVARPEKKKSTEYA